MKRRAGSRPSPSSADGGIDFALETLLELQVRSASSLRRLVGFQSALAACSQDPVACVDELRGLLASHTELLGDLGVLAVAFRFDGTPDEVSASQGTSGIWSAFEDGTYMCVELFGSALVGQNEEVEAHEFVFGSGAPPNFHSLVYLTGSKAAIEVHEHVHFGRRELGKAVETWLRVVEEHRTRAVRLAALEEMGAIALQATVSMSIDFFATESLALRVIDYHRELADRYLKQVCSGWDLDAVELFGLPLGAPTCLAQSGSEALWMKQPPVPDWDQAFPEFLAAETVLHEASGRAGSDVVQVSLPFSFQGRRNWGLVVVTSNRLLDDEDLLSLAQVARNLGQIIETTFAVHRELRANLQDPHTGRPNEAVMRGVLQQLRSERTPSSLILLGVVDRMKYLETIGTLGLADVFNAGCDELDNEFADFPDRSVTGILSASIMFAVIEGSFKEREAKDDLERKVWAAMSRLKLSGANSNLHPVFAIAGVAVGEDADYDDVVAGAYSTLDRAMRPDSDSSSVHWDLVESGAAQRTRLKREMEITAALDAGEFVSFFQPEYSLRDGSLLSFESLVRWDHPERGLVGPDEFIPLVESSGLVVQSDMRQLRTAVAEAVSWGLGESGPEMRVNLSSSSLHYEGLAAQMLEICDAEGLAPTQLVIEVTETAILRNLETAIGQLRELREAGVGVALDDFGVGESSLTRLRALPISIVKLDRQFVVPLPGTRSDRAFVEALRTMILALDLGITAEGVETEAQRDCLLEIGIDRAQGYLFSKPVPAAEARLLLGTSVDVPDVA